MCVFATNSGERITTSPPNVCLLLLLLLQQRKFSNKIKLPINHSYCILKRWSCCNIIIARYLNGGRTHILRRSFFFSHKKSFFFSRCAFETGDIIITHRVDFLVSITFSGSLFHTKRPNDRKSNETVRRQLQNKQRQQQQHTYIHTVHAKASIGKR